MRLVRCATSLGGFETLIELTEGSDLLIVECYAFDRTGGTL